MKQTSLPETKGSVSTNASVSGRCPQCGQPYKWVIGRVGGGYSYQPCGCYGGKITR